MKRSSRHYLRPAARVRKLVREVSEILVELKVLIVEIVVFIGFIYLLLK